MTLLGELVCPVRLGSLPMQAIGSTHFPQGGFVLTKTVKVLQKTHGRCAYCGINLMDSGVEFNLEHFLPVKSGGTGSISNLVPSCRPCNSAKKSLVLSDENDLDVMRMRLALRKSHLHGIITGTQAVKLISLGVKLPVFPAPLWFEVNCHEIANKLKESNEA